MINMPKFIQENFEKGLLTDKLVFRIFDLPEEYIEKYIEKHIEKPNSIYWSDIFRRQKLSETFLRKYTSRIVFNDWGYIIKNQQLSLDFIQEFINYIDLDFVFSNYELSEDFMFRNFKLINWSMICKYQNLSERFIRNHLYYVNWDLISMYQTLSESFIEEFHDFLDWRYLSKFQNLSNSFIEKYGEYLYWGCLLNRKDLKLSEEVLIKNQRFMSSVSLRDFIEKNNYNFSPKFYEKIICNHDYLFILTLLEKGLIFEDAILNSADNINDQTLTSLYKNLEFSELCSDSFYDKLFQTVEERNSKKKLINIYKEKHGEA